MIAWGVDTSAESSCNRGELLPVCSVAARCGGCPRIFDPIAAQRADKARRVLDLLDQRGVVTPHEPVWLATGGTGYRNRIRLAMTAGVPQFFNHEKHEACAVLEPALRVAVQQFRSWAEVYQPLLSGFRVAEVRAPDADQMAAVYLRHTERNGQQQMAPCRSGLPSTFAGGVVAFEAGPIEYQRVYVTSDVWIWIPVGGFSQVNTSVNQLMVQQVVAWLVARQAATFLDLFSGSGNFSVALRTNGLAGTAVEWDSAGCAAQVRSLATHGFTDVVVVRGDALAETERLVQAGERYDCVVVDPPRRGLRGQVSAVTAAARKTIVLVSCNTQQFVNDASALTMGGFRLAEYRLVDMFPHTDHVELLGCFERV